MSSIAVLISVLDDVQECVLLNSCHGLLTDMCQGCYCTHVNAFSDQC